MMYGVRVLPSEVSGDGCVVGGAIVRSVVDHDEIGVRMARTTQGLEATFKGAPSVGYDYRDEGP